MPSGRSTAAPQLLALDLDGTLLDPSTGRPHERDALAVRAAIAAGVRVTLVTGRLYSGTRDAAEVLGVRGVVACADGSHLVRAHDHATVVHVGVEGEAASKLRGIFGRHGAATFVFAGDAIGHDAAGAPYLDYLTTWSRDIRPAIDVHAHALWEEALGVTAVVAVGAREQIEAITGDLGRELPGALRVASFPMRRGVHAGQWATIVRAMGETKGTALRAIAAMEGVAIERTVCVGDWINDVPMFEVAGRSFVMGQAPDEVKARASDVLVHTAVAGGGVARAIEVAFGVWP